MFGDGQGGDSNSQAGTGVGDGQDGASQSGPGAGTQEGSGDGDGGWLGDSVPTNPVDTGGWPTGTTPTPGYTVDPGAWGNADQGLGGGNGSVSGSLALSEETEEQTDESGIFAGFLGLMKDFAEDVKETMASLDDKLKGLFGKEDQPWGGRRTFKEELFAHPEGFFPDQLTPEQKLGYAEQLLTDIRENPDDYSKEFLGLNLYDAPRQAIFGQTMNVLGLNIAKQFSDPLTQQGIFSGFKQLGKLTDPLGMTGHFTAAGEFVGEAMSLGLFSSEDEAASYLGEQGITAFGYEGPFTGEEQTGTRGMNTTGESELGDLYIGNIPSYSLESEGEFSPSRSYGAPEQEGKKEEKFSPLSKKITPFGFEDLNFMDDELNLGVSLLAVSYALGKAKEEEPYVF